MIWENGIETCVISYMKRVASPGSMHDTGCLGLVHWDDPEGWDGDLLTSKEDFYACDHRSLADFENKSIWSRQGLTFSIILFYAVSDIMKFLSMREKLFNLKPIYFLSHGYGDLGKQLWSH